MELKNYQLTKFQETLDNVVKGLNHAGFSDKDYRSVELTEPATPNHTEPTPTLPLFPIEDKPQYTAPTETCQEDKVDIKDITFNPAEETTPTDNNNNIVNDILHNAQKEAENMENRTDLLYL